MPDNSEKNEKHWGDIPESDKMEGGKTPKEEPISEGPSASTERTQPEYPEGEQKLLVMGIYEREGIADSLRDWLNKGEAMSDGLFDKLMDNEGHVIAEVDG